MSLPFGLSDVRIVQPFTLIVYTDIGPVTMSHGDCDKAWDSMEAMCIRYTCSGLVSEAGIAAGAYPLDETSAPVVLSWSLMQIEGRAHQVEPPSYSHVEGCPFTGRLSYGGCCDAYIKGEL